MNSPAVKVLPTNQKAEGLSYLGHSIRVLKGRRNATRSQVSIAPTRRAIKRWRTRWKQILRHSSEMDSPDLVSKLNRLTSGWNAAHRQSGLPLEFSVRRERVFQYRSILAAIRSREPSSAELVDPATWGIEPLRPRHFQRSDDPQQRTKNGMRRRALPPTNPRRKPDRRKGLIGSESERVNASRLSSPPLPLLVRRARGNHRSRRQAASMATIESSCTGFSQRRDGVATGSEPKTSFLERLGARAKRFPDQPFSNLYHALYQVDLLTTAFTSFPDNTTPGASGITLEEFSHNLKEKLAAMAEELASGRFSPSPLRSMTMRSRGRERLIQIPEIRDRIVQKVMVRVLNAILEPHFFDCSHAYREGRGAQTALCQVHDLLTFGDVPYVLRTDVANFFSRVPRTLTGQFLRKHVADNRFIRLLQAFLNAPIQGRAGRPPGIGFPVGAPISAPLSNLVLHNVIDSWWSRTGRTAALVRYSDDLFVACKSFQEATSIKESIDARLRKFGLNLSKEKTTIRRL